MQVKVIVKAGMAVLLACSLIACAERSNPVLNEVSQTPTPETTLTPFPVPEQGITGTPGIQETPTPTKAPATLTPTVSDTPSATPTETVDATDTPAPTALPTATPTGTPEPTKEPTASPTITPTYDPMPLVTNGWQQAADISGSYQIIFPDCYDTTTLLEGEHGFGYLYTSAKDPAVSFQIRYFLEDSYENWREQLKKQYPGIVITESETEQRFDYVFLNETEYREGTVYACYYEQTGTDGVTQVEFFCPAKEAAAYQTEAYRWYLCR